MKLAHLISFVFLVNTYQLSAKELHLATTDWSPYFSKELPENGYFSALVREAAKRSGVKLNISFIPWKRALKDSKKGVIDGLHGAYYSEERTHFYWFSAPIAVVRAAIFKRESAKNIPSKYNTLQELKDYSIGVGRGYKIADEFDAASYLKKYEANNHIFSMKMLAKNRVELVADAYEAIMFELKNNPEIKTFNMKLVALKPYLSENNLHITISKRSKNFDKKFLDKFNQSLESMKKDGTYDKIMNQFGMK